jgi:hypothetical protein
MDTKLTLKLNESIIEKAKVYARLHKTSLSGIIENFLQKLTDEENEKKQITPLVKSLSGIIELPNDAGYKKDYSDFLISKYK